tara:strand:+ start:8349 stop:8528 length:180 start_codon:yes stop_codon:yes gene_type:complete
MSPDDVEAELRRTLTARLGEQRVAELESEIVGTAKQLAMVLNEPVELDDEDPDFMRPLV